MPTYEYVCRTCGRMFEIVQSMSDAPLTICDVCGGELRKVFTAPAISFKGSGFYATDSRKQGSKHLDEKAPEKKESSKESSKEPSTGSSKGPDGAPRPTEKSPDTGEKEKKREPAAKKEPTAS